MKETWYSDPHCLLEAWRRLLESSAYLTKNIYMCRTNCTETSSPVHSLVQKGTACLLVLRLSNHGWQFWSDFQTPNADVITLKFNKKTASKYLKNFSTCQMRSNIKTIPQKRFVAKIWPINNWTKYWPVTYWPASKIKTN